MTNTIYFDMDGTIANLYGVNGWLEMLINRETTPYEKAEPMVRMNSLARVLNTLKRKGFKVGIVSWLAKNSNENYDRAVAEAKRRWLSTHLKSVSFDAINIVAYGTCKDNFRHTTEDILFDDEEHNRNSWNGKAFDVNNILEILKRLS